LSKQGTADRREHVTLTVLQKLAIIRGLKVVKGEERLWLHAMLIVNCV
jgi:hypothetical protein